MSPVNETSAAHIHIVILLLLQDGHLPGILPELCVALLVTLGGVVDPPVDPMGVPLAALAVLTEGLAAGGHTVQGLTELLRLMSHVPVERKYLVNKTKYFRLRLSDEVSLKKAVRERLKFQCFRQTCAGRTDGRTNRQTL